MMTGAHRQTSMGMREGGMREQEGRLPLPPLPPFPSPASVWWGGGVRRRSGVKGKKQREKERWLSLRRRHDWGFATLRLFCPFTRTSRLHPGGLHGIRIYGITHEHIHSPELRGWTTHLPPEVRIADSGKGWYFAVNHSILQYKHLLLYYTIMQVYECIMHIQQFGNDLSRHRLRPHPPGAQAWVVGGLLSQPATCLSSSRQQETERKKHFPENATLPFFFTSPPRQNQTAIFKTLLSKKKTQFRRTLMQTSQCD